MSISKKSFARNQLSAQTYPQTLPPNPTSNTSPLLKSAKVRVGPGMSRINLTRKEVEEKLSTYRQQQKARNQESLWQRLTNVFGKSRVSE